MKIAICDDEKNICIELEDLLTKNTEDKGIIYDIDIFDSGKALCKKLKETNYDLIFLDIPLLFESNLEYLCDAVIVVYLKEDEEIKRLMKRDNIDEDYARLIIGNQMSIEEKKMRADIVLDNNQGLDELYQQTKKEKADIILDNSGSLENLYKQIEELLKGR